MTPNLLKSGKTGSGLTTQGSESPKPLRVPSRLQKSASCVKKGTLWWISLFFPLFSGVQCDPEAEEEEEDGTFLYHNTPPPHVPSARLICVNYQLNAGNRIQTSNSNFLLNFCVTLLVFVAGVGEARVVPSPWPGHPIKGTGPLCLRGPPPCGYYYI